MDMNSSIRKAVEKGLGASMIQMFTSQFTKTSECSICLLPFENMDKLAKLPCFDSHIFHEECMEEYMKAKIAKNEEIVCPYCRKPFKKEDIVKKVLKDDVAPATGDPFALNKN